MFEQTPVFTIAPARAIKTGMWRKDAAPREVWAGTMTDSGYPDADVEVEIYEKGEGVLRTAYGWFAISKFAHDAQGTRFEVDTLDEVPPNALDRAIIERAGVRTSIG